jgi:hypothetical protein
MLQQRCTSYRKTFTFDGRTGGPFKPGFGLSGGQHFWEKRYYDFNIRN